MKGTFLLMEPRGSLREDPALNFVTALRLLLRYPRQELLKTIQGRLVTYRHAENAMWRLLFLDDHVIQTTMARLDIVLSS